MRAAPLILSAILMAPGGLAAQSRYASYLGGRGDDSIVKMVAATGGDIYIAGVTRSEDFPVTAGAFQTRFGGERDAFVARIKSSGEVVYCTLIGGAREDEAWDLAVDVSGSAYLTGISNSDDFPVSAGAYKSSGRPFAVKLNPAGTELAYSTFLDGAETRAFGIAVDNLGQAYVTGTTNSSSSFQSPARANDVFVLKLDAVGSRVLYARLAGGSANEEASRIAVDGEGRVYVAGGTRSADFPTTEGAFRRSKAAGNSEDGFVFKLSADGATLIYSTYLGGSGPEGIFDLALGPGGTVFATGITYSPDFPVTTGAVQSAYGGNGDAFVTQLNASGSRLVFSTYLGGEGADNGQAIAVTRCGEALVTGRAGAGFPATPDTPPAGPDGSVFLARFSATGAALRPPAVFGGNESESGNGIAGSASGEIYVAGTTSSPDFPVTLEARQQASAGRSNGFITIWKARAVADQ